MSTKNKSYSLSSPATLPTNDIRDLFEKLQDQVSDWR